MRIRLQNMVVSYLVLTGRLLESRWSKSQVVLPRECMSASISRGSICRGGGREEGREEGVRRAAVRHTDKSSAHTRACGLEEQSSDHVIIMDTQGSIHNMDDVGHKTACKQQRYTKATTSWEFENTLISC